MLKTLKINTNGFLGMLKMRNFKNYFGTLLDDPNLRIFESDEDEIDFEKNN